MLLTGEQEGYYGDYPASLTALARQYERMPAQKLVFCSQNHDQVGNRALGDRPKPDELRLRAAALLWAAQTPLLFMGEEYGEQRPFQFFTDHTDPAIAEATRDGRAQEFEQFTAFSGEDVPDPQAAATFQRSKLHPEHGDPHCAPSTSGCSSCAASRTTSRPRPTRRTARSGCVAATRSSF